MTEEQYFEKINELEIQHKNAVDQLQKQYALSNNPHNQGDIIEDHMHRICIDKINIVRSYGKKLPSCAYEGVTYTKRNEPSKKHTRETIYQENIKLK